MTDHQIAYPVIVEVGDHCGLGRLRDRHRLITHAEPQGYELAFVGKSVHIAVGARARADVLRVGNAVCIAIGTRELHRGPENQEYGDHGSGRWQVESGMRHKRRIHSNMVPLTRERVNL